MIWIVGYTLSVAVAYAVARIFITDMDSEFSSIVLAWLVAVVWPVFLAVLIVSLPFVLAGKLIDIVIVWVMDWLERRRT